MFLTCVVVNTTSAVLHIHVPSGLLSIWAVLNFEGKHPPDLFHELLPVLFKVQTAVRYNQPEVYHRFDKLTFCILRQSYSLL